MGDTYTRQSAAAIAVGNVITASDLEDEFDQVLAAFNSSTGHVHDGTDAPRISTIGPAGEYTSTATEFKPTTTGLDLGASASQWDNAYIDGIAYIDTATIGENEYVTITDNEYDVSSGNLTFDVVGDVIIDTESGNVLLKTDVASVSTAFGALAKDINDELVIKSGATPTTAVTFSGANATFANNVDVSGQLDVTGSTTFDGNVSLGSSSALTVSNQIILTGELNTIAGGNILGPLVPSSDDQYDLGSSLLKWQDIYIDGTAYLDSISSASASLTDATIGTGTVSFLKTQYIQASDGTQAFTIANTTGNATIDTTLLASDVDISGGEIDGTPIGANSASTGAFTTLTATNPSTFDSNLTVDGNLFANSNFSTANANITGGNIDGTVIGFTTPAAGYFTTADIDGGSVDGVTIGSNSAATTLKVDSLTIDDVSSVPTVTVDASSGSSVAGKDLDIYAGQSTGDGSGGVVKFYATNKYWTIAAPTSLNPMFEAATIGLIDTADHQLGEIVVNGILRTKSSAGGDQGVYTSKLNMTSTDTYSTYSSITSGVTVGMQVTIDGATTGNNNFTVDADDNIELNASDAVVLQHGNSTTDYIYVGEEGATNNYGTMFYEPSTNTLGLGVNSTGIGATTRPYNYFLIEKKDANDYGVYLNNTFQPKNSYSASALVGTVVLETGTHSVHNVTLDANATIYVTASQLNDGTNSSSLINNAVQKIIVKVTQDSTGSRTLNWVSSTGTILWEGGSAPTQTATADKTDIYELINFGGEDKFYARRIGANF